MTAPDSASVPQPATSRKLSRRSSGIASLLAAQLLLGLIAGAVWRLLSPRTVAFLVQDSRGSTVLIPDESENQIAGDGRFMLLTVIAGVLLAVAAWFLLRQLRGPLLLAALAVGSLLGSIVARWFGEALSSPGATSSDHSVVHPALSLHAQPILLLQAFAAVVVYTALAGFSDNPEFTRSAPKAEDAAGPVLVAQ